MVISTVFLALSIFLTQFYVFSSGTLQPAYFLYLFFFLFYTITKKGMFTDKRIGPIHKYCFVFLFYVAFVNAIYSIIEQEVTFNFFSVYLLYNVVLFCFLVDYLSKNNLHKVYVFYVIAISIVVLAIISFSGLGRSRFFPRYNGYFNDPNQMAFWVMCGISCVYLLLDNKHIVKFLLFLASCYLIFITSSRSGFVGLSVVTAGVIYSFFENTNDVRLRFKLVFIIFGIILAPIVVLNLFQYESFFNLINRFAMTDLYEQADVRGYTRILNYPEYLLLGAGQAMDDRFSGGIGEIHSTWAGFLFYYGIVGFSLFSIFLFNVYKNINTSQYLIASGPLLYSFFTFGARSPVFWLFLAVVYSSVRKN